MPNTSSSTSPSGLHRRLSARRGSITALDPYAVHADINENPNRTSSSKLTIVRVLPSQPPQPSTPITLNEAPASLTSSSRRKRLGSSGAAAGSGGAGGGGSTGQADSPPPGRLSFAFSSFGAAAADSGHQVGGGGHQRTGSGGAPSSPSSSPRMRPSSPRLSANPYQHHHQHHHHHQSGIGLKPRLTPDQLVELARQASSPRTLAQIANSSSTGSAGPASPAPSSSGAASPVLRSQPLSANLTGGGAVSTNVAPATFTPLPDDIFLPFIDRPSEVAQLISIPPDAKLFALLAQTLPKTYEPPAGTGTITVVDPVTGEEAVLEELPNDPSLWTYDHLIYHLTQVDRDVAPDPIWAFAARKCILSHSELLWERVKGGLGVPPELDIDYDFTRTHQRTHSEEKLDAKMRKLRQELRDGAPKNRLGQSASHNESALDDEESESEEEEDVEDKVASGKWTAATNVRGVEKPSPAGSTPVAGGRSDSVHEAGGVVIGSFNNPSSSIGIAMEGPSPPLGATNEGLEDDDVDDDFISIEPLIAPSTESVGALGSNPPPLSLGTSTLLEEGLASDTPAGEGMGLGDIAEGEEEEEEEEAEKQAVDNTAAQRAKAEETKQVPEEELIPPCQIQGLRILTSPVHAAGAYGVGGLFVPHHQHPSSLLHPTNLDGSAANMMASPLPLGEDGAATPGTGTTLAQALASGAHEAIQATTQPHVISPPAGGYPAHSRTSSFSSITGISIGPFSRSESTGSLAALIAAQQQHYAGSDAGDSTGYASDWSVGATGGGSNASGSVTGVQSSAEVVGDRLPGQPLFVSNFARLNGCPTLKGGVPNPAVERRNHAPPRFKLKRTGSTGAVVGSVPSSSFLGSHSPLASGHSKALSDVETPSSPKARTYSHGASSHGQGRPGSWTGVKGTN